MPPQAESRHQHLRRAGRRSFLPGYGLDTVRWWRWPRFLLARRKHGLRSAPPHEPALADTCRNLIYANGVRCVCRFHRDIDGEQGDAVFEVNIDREAITETSAARVPGALSSSTLRATSSATWTRTPVADFRRRRNRFQMSVAAGGREQGRHNGGTMYGWGGASCRSAAASICAWSTSYASSFRAGFPSWGIRPARCGQSIRRWRRSPIDELQDGHNERCGRKPDSIGFADIVADSLTPPECAHGGVQCAGGDPHGHGAGARHAPEDLLILVIGHVDRDEVDGVSGTDAGRLGAVAAACRQFPDLSGRRALVSGCPSAREHPARLPAHASQRFITSRSTGTLPSSCSRHGATS